MAKHMTCREFRPPAVAAMIAVMRNDPALLTCDPSIAQHYLSIAAREAGKDPTVTVDLSVVQFIRDWCMHPG
jgi:hypothetical protein